MSFFFQALHVKKNQNTPRLINSSSTGLPSTSSRSLTVATPPIHRVKGSSPRSGCTSTTSQPLRVTTAGAPMLTVPSTLPTPIFTILRLSF